jgi:mono/diheme cytochrome c family protein
MDEKAKQEYLEKYHQAKEKGVPFFPDILFKDAVISLLVFVLLVVLAYFVGAPLEARANPADTSYTPRPEWYFLFLFKLLKYFPGRIEFLGVVILPTLVILLLFLLPFLDASPKRYFLSRPVVMGVTSIGIVGIITLTVLAVREAPPPSAPTTGDQTAALYASNCASCHGQKIVVPEGTNLHALIAQGKHEGMPAWSGDLTSDQIDALAGFILSPTGSQIFTDNCAECHQVQQLVASDPLKLKNALEEGPDYEPHAGAGVPDWNKILNAEEQTALLNFLIAPDGQRLFTTNCSACHGRSVAFSGSEQELAAIISQGGLHLEMPPWKGKLSDTDLSTLAGYVVDPASTPAGDKLFKQNCSSCHGDRVPSAPSVEQATQMIAQGGAHQTMPVWGNILTPEQINALVKYTLEAANGAPIELGQQLFSKNCTACHGEFGEGGPNPVHPGDTIGPISTSEFLKTRDDYTLRAIISQGQPDIGMSPFGTAFGGPLDDSEVDAIVAYIRSWEANPPVQLPPEITTGSVALTGDKIYADVCAQCHGPNGEGGVGPSLQAAQFQSQNSDQDIFDTINLGHKATPMIAWGEILTTQQIQQLVKFIRRLGELTPSETPEATPTNTPQVSASKTPEATGTASPQETETVQVTPVSSPTQTQSSNLTFGTNIQPIFQEKCAACHGSLGGWDSSTYDSVMNTGDNSPVIIPGDVENSLLAKKIQGTQPSGMQMPPTEKLPEDEIQIILDWIAAGAPEN